MKATVKSYQQSQHDNISWYVLTNSYKMTVEDAWEYLPLEDSADVSFIEMEQSVVNLNGFKRCFCFHEKIK
jgi:hypothetical protein